MYRYIAVLTHWLACSFMMMHEFQWDEKGCTSDEDVTYCTWLIKYESYSYNGSKGLERAPIGRAVRVEFSLPVA